MVIKIPRVVQFINVFNENDLHEKVQSVCARVPTVVHGALNVP